MSNILDITSWKDRNLATAIKKAVKDTQLVFVKPYPDMLKMTRRQYDKLKPQFLEQQYEGQEFYLYKTPYNVMEIEIDG